MAVGPWIAKARQLLVEVYRRTLQIVECFFGLVPAYNMWHHVVNTPFNHVMVDVDEYDEEAEIHCIHS